MGLTFPVRVRISTHDSGGEEATSPPAYFPTPTLRREIGLEEVKHINHRGNGDFWTVLCTGIAPPGGKKDSCIFPGGSKTARDGAGIGEEYQSALFYW